MKNLFILFLLLMAHAGQAQWQWVEFNSNGSGFPQQQQLFDAVVDSNDDVFVLGIESGTTSTVYKYDGNGAYIAKKNISISLGYSSNFEQDPAIQESGNTLYVCGKGKIVSADKALSTTQDWTQPSGGNVTYYDIHADGGFLYAVGNFYLPTGQTSTTVDFGGGITFTASQSGGFVVKYNLATATPVWARAFQGPIFQAEEVSVDNNNNVYVGGFVRGDFFVVGNSTPHSHPDPVYGDAFLIKLDSSGNIDTTWGNKFFSSNISQERIFDLTFDAGSKALFALTNLDNKGVVAKFNTTNGTEVWRNVFNSRAQPHKATVNSCGDVYTTGRTFSQPATLRAGPCGANYFLQSLDSATGSKKWEKYGVSCSSMALSIGLFSNQDIFSMGQYGGAIPPKNITIDNTYNSNDAGGRFLLRYRDEQNSCCSREVTLGEDIEVCEGDNYPLLTANISSSGITNVRWYKNGVLVPSTFNALTYQTTGPGSYKVVIIYGESCSITDSITITEKDCRIECCNNKLAFWTDVPSPPTYYFPGNNIYPELTYATEIFKVQVPSSIPITKLKASVVSFEWIAEDACKTCIKSPLVFGSIFGLGDIGSGPNKLALQNPSHADPNTLNAEIIWGNPAGADLSAGNSIRITYILPPGYPLECCNNKAKVCVRFTYEDADCGVCEVFTCTEFELKSPLDKRMRQKVDSSPVEKLFGKEKKPKRKMKIK